MTEKNGNFITKQSAGRTYYRLDRHALRVMEKRAGYNDAGLSLSAGKSRAWLSWVVNKNEGYIPEKNYSEILEAFKKKGIDIHFGDMLECNLMPKEDEATTGNELFLEQMKQKEETTKTEEPVVVEKDSPVNEMLIKNLDITLKELIDVISDQNTRIAVLEQKIFQSRKDHEDALKYRAMMQYVNRMNDAQEKRDMENWRDTLRKANDKPIEELRKEFNSRYDESKLVKFR